MYPLYKKQVDEKKIAVFKCTVTEFYSNWICSPAYDNEYWNIIGCCVTPWIGEKLLNDVSVNDLLNVLEKILSRKGGLRQVDFTEACSAISCFFKDAMDLHCAAQDNGTIASNMMKERKKSEDTRHLSHYTAFGTYTPQQLIQLLAISRKEAPDLYLPMLLASTAGLQIAEIIRLTFDNVNFYNQTLCLPYTSNDSFPFRADTVPREDNKVVFLSGVVMTEIQRQKERLDVLQKADPSFNLGGYLIWDRNGNRRKNNFIGKPYARILSMCPFPTFPWKNLRRIQMEPYSIKKLEESFEKEGALEVNAYQIPFEKNYLLELLK